MSLNLDNITEKITGDAFRLDRQAGDLKSVQYVCVSNAAGTCIFNDDMVRGNIVGFSAEASYGYGYGENNWGEADYTTILTNTKPTTGFDVLVKDMTTDQDLLGGAGGNITTDSGMFKYENDTTLTKLHIFVMDKIQVYATNMGDTKTFSLTIIFK